MMPKLTILHFERCSGVTKAGIMSYTREAVSRWMSSPFLNAVSIAASLENAAIRRSSICE